MDEPNNIEVATTTTVKVKDERGRTYELRRKGDGVVIQPPVAIRNAPVPIADLRAALDELEGEGR